MNKPFKTFFTPGKCLLPPCRLSTLFNRKIPVRKLARLSSIIMYFSILFENKNMNITSYYSSLTFLKCCFDDKTTHFLLEASSWGRHYFHPHYMVEESEVQNRVKEAHRGLQRRQMTYLPRTYCVFRTALVSVKVNICKMLWNHAVFSLNLWIYFSKTNSPIESSFPFLFIDSKIIWISPLDDYYFIETTRTNPDSE